MHELIEARDEKRLWSNEGSIPQHGHKMVQIICSPHYFSAFSHPTRTHCTNALRFIQAKSRWPETCGANVLIIQDIVTLAAMHESASLSRPTSTFSDDSNVTPKLRSALAQAIISDPVEKAASFGRWWHDAETAQLVLSAGAAGMLGVEVGWHPTLESCFAHVVPDDVLMLMSALATAGVAAKQIECEFRIVNEVDGLRWLRLMSVPHALAYHEVPSGVLLDITSAKHAAIRERLSFESTQFLVGTNTLGEAVTKVIQLVCENLGWEWGAYWALESAQMGAQQLACKHFWHGPRGSLDAFTQESCTIRMAPGAGLVGQVWQTGEARWIENMANDQVFLRYNSAQTCSLRSGYVFPVVYVTDDGHPHSPGVLEFL
ncbi:GAF domain-containing protein [Undibacterium arcticum]